MKPGDNLNALTAKRPEKKKSKSKKEEEEE